MSVPLPHLRAAIVATPWAIVPSRLEAICEVIERRCEGIRLSEDEIAALKGKREPNGVISALIPIEHDIYGAVATSLLARGQTSAQPQARNIAVIRAAGVLAPHASSVDDISGPGGTSVERLKQSFAQAMDDPTVAQVVLHFESPGGVVSSIPEFAAQIFAARNRKPVIAHVSEACSAAYWLASQCSHIAMDPSGTAGSIGVYAMHQDVSAANEKAGVKLRYISAGKYKVDGNPYEPLSEQAEGHIQETVDSFHHDFVTDVARGRGRSFEQVYTGFGEGRSLRSGPALKMGLVDSIGTLDDTLRKLAAGKPLGRGARADDPLNVDMAASQQAAFNVAQLFRTDLGPTASYRLGFSFAEAMAAAEERVESRIRLTEQELEGQVKSQTAALVEQLNAINARLEEIGKPMRIVGGDSEPRRVAVSEPQADTSPLMKICDTCGCNMEAASTDAAPQAGPTGMGEGDMPTEHPQSSKMERCADCGRMREPPAARDGTGAGNGAEAPSREQIEAAKRKADFRRRGFAAKLAAIDARIAANG